MKNTLKTLLVACLSVALLAGCGGSGNKDESGSDSSVPSIVAPEDVLIEHTILQTDQQEEFTEYQVVYFGHDTNTLKGLQVQVNFDKDAGFTEESLDAINVDDIYSNFSTMSFASKQIFDDGDTIALVLLFEDLDDPANLRTLHENGIIQLQNPDTSDPVSAKSYVDVMTAAGASEVEAFDAENIHYLI